MDFISNEPFPSMLLCVIDHWEFDHLDKNQIV